MKIVLQRVSRAAVEVENNIVGKIDNGYVALVGFGENDDKPKVEKMVDKIKKLRIFPDENGKINLSAGDVGGSILILSQFTLYADCRQNRPSFTNAANPALAEELYNYFIECADGKFNKVEHGIFGAKMEVELVNDGPFTVILEGI